LAKITIQAPGPIPSLGYYTNQVRGLKTILTTQYWFPSCMWYNIFRLKIDDPDSPTSRSKVVEHQFSNGHILSYMCQNQAHDTSLGRYLDEECIGRGIQDKTMIENSIKCEK